MAKDKDEAKQPHPMDEPKPLETGSEVAVRTTGTEIAVADFGDDAGKGMEGMTADEYRIPFLRILDPKSPQCAPIPHGLGLKPGTLFNIATGESFDGEKGVEFVPCARDHNFVQWKKRDDNGSGGGFVQSHEIDDPFVLKLRAEQGRFKKLVVPNANNEIAEGFYLYCIVYDEYGVDTRVIVGFTGMQIKKYQAFINRYDSIKYLNGDTLVKPPLWAHRWKLQTVYEKRGDQSWYGYKISLAERTPEGNESPRASLMRRSDPRYEAGKAFYELVKAGKVHAEYATAEAERQPGDDADEIPM